MNQSYYDPFNLSGNWGLGDVVQNNFNSVFKDPSGYQGSWGPMQGYDNTSPLVSGFQRPDNFGPQTRWEGAADAQSPVTNYQQTFNDSSGNPAYEVDWDPITGGYRVNQYVGGAGGGAFGSRRTSRYNDVPYDVYDKDNNFLGSGKYSGFEDSMSPLLGAAAVGIGGPLIGGALAGMAGAGAAGAGSAASGGSAMAGMDALYGGFAAPSLGTMSVGGAAGAGGGLSSIISKLGGKIGMNGLQSVIGNLLGGQGGGDMNLGNLGSLISGGVDAYQQGKAANTMLDWLNSQQNKIEGYYKPDSPEYKKLWDEMSRKDAAAGRNSQYGHRTSDFLAKVAGNRADNTTRFTTGTSRALSDALTQRANRFAGLGLGAGANSVGGGGGLGQIIQQLFGSGISGGDFDLSGNDVPFIPDMSNADIEASWGLVDDLNFADWW